MTKNKRSSAIKSNTREKEKDSEEVNNKKLKGPTMRSSWFENKASIKEYQR
jgi:hypothetical protein